jgi:putative NADH-flavin reductase
MKLLVIGASRGIGLEVVKQALSRGYEVRAFARSAASIRLSNPRLEKQSGSALNVSDVSSAMPGVDAVVLTLGSTTLAFFPHFHIRDESQTPPLRSWQAI